MCKSYKFIDHQVHQKQKVSKASSLSLASYDMGEKVVIDITFLSSSFKNYGFRVGKSEFDKIIRISTQTSISLIDFYLVVFILGKSGSIYIS